MPHKGADVRPPDKRFKRAGSRSRVVRPSGHPRARGARLHRHFDAAARRGPQAICDRGYLSSACRVVHARGFGGPARPHAAPGYRAGRDRMVDSRCARARRRHLPGDRVRQAISRFVSWNHAASRRFADDGVPGGSGADGARRDAGANHAGDQYRAGAPQRAGLRLHVFRRRTQPVAIRAGREAVRDSRRLAASCGRHPPACRRRRHRALPRPDRRAQHSVPAGLRHRGDGNSSGELPGRSVKDHGDPGLRLRDVLRLAWHDGVDLPQARLGARVGARTHGVPAQHGADAGGDPGRSAGRNVVVFRALPVSNLYHAAAVETDRAGEGG